MKRDSANRSTTQSPLGLTGRQTELRGTMDMSEDDQIGNGETGIPTDLCKGQDHHADDKTEEASDERKKIPYSTEE